LFLFQKDLSDLMLTWQHTSFISSEKVIWRYFNLTTRLYQLWQLSTVMLTWQYCIPLRAAVIYRYFNLTTHLCQFEWFYHYFNLEKNTFISSNRYLPLCQLTTRLYLFEQLFTVILTWQHAFITYVSFGSDIIYRYVHLTTRLDPFR